MNLVEVNKNQEKNMKYCLKEMMHNKKNKKGHKHIPWKEDINRKECKPNRWGISNMGAIQMINHQKEQCYQTSIFKIKVVSNKIKIRKI